MLADTAPGVSDLEEVITNIRNWIIGLLVALATLLLTVGGLRYVLAGGDPGEVGKAKDTLKFSALGFAVAILAPLLVEILRGFVGLS
ncbi:pilin [Nocardiopsis coralliicola]